MKNLLNFFFVVAITVISGCKKNSDLPLIVHKWHSQPATYETYINGILSSTTTQNFDEASYLEFKSDETWISLENTVPRKGTYRTEGDTLIFNNINKGKIKILTSAALSYVFKDTLSSNRYLNVTFNYIK